MDDFPLKQRIQSAVLFHAATLLGGTQNTAWNYGVSALLNPQSLDPTMLALVCVDQTIAGAVVVSADGGSVTTSAVPDAAILTAVSAKWSLVAVKYPTNPLTQAAT